MKSARVLVVDDEPDLVETVVDHLQMRGILAAGATSGPLALEAHVEARARGIRYDVAVVDLKMPGMDGFETIRRLRQLDPALAIVVITGIADEDTGVRVIREMGLAGYLLKPLDYEHLRLIIERIIAEKRTLPMTPSGWSRLSRAALLVVAAAGLVWPAIFLGLYFAPPPFELVYEMPRPITNPEVSSRAEALTVVRTAWKPGETFYLWIEYCAATPLIGAVTRRLVPMHREGPNINVGDTSYVVTRAGCAHQPWPVRLPTTTPPGMYEFRATFLFPRSVGQVQTVTLPSIPVVIVPGDEPGRRK